MLKKKILEYTAQIDNKIDDFITVTVNRELTERNVKVNAKEIAEAVDKQIAVKPIPDGRCEYSGEPLYKCPACGDSWNSNEFRMKCCWECGQRLDWSDDND